MKDKTKIRCFFRKVFRRKFWNQQLEEINTTGDISLQEIDMMMALGWSITKVRTVKDRLKDRGFITEVGNTKPAVEVWK